MEATHLATNFSEFWLALNSMGTRGYLVFKWKGVYYTIYNHWDSYPSGMGFAIVRQIIEWMRRYQGNKEKVKEFLFTLLEGVKFKTEYDYSDDEEEDEEEIVPVPGIHPLNQNGYEDLEMKLRDTTRRIVIVSKGVEPPAPTLFIEFIWIIDADDGELLVKHGQQAEAFPWHQLYFLGAKKWISFEKYDEDVGTCFDSKAMLEEYIRICSVRCQAVARGFLERRRSFCPPNGLQYLLAKKRFESETSTGT
jgi:hypothetical protein